MNKFLSVGVLTLAMALTACGGDSDSSGSSAPAANNNSGNTALNTTKPTNPKANQCKIEGKNVLVPQGSCDISIPGVNGGAVSTYYCSGQRVSLGNPQSGSITANKLTLGDYVIECE